MSYSVPCIVDCPHEYALRSKYEADGVDEVDVAEIADRDHVAVPYDICNVVASSRWSRFVQALKCLIGPMRQRWRLLLRNFVPKSDMVSSVGT